MSPEHNDVAWQQPTDSYRPYETGLQRLLERMGRDHDRYDEAETYRQRLEENIARSRQYGDTETRRAERAEILGRLNNLTQATLGYPFSALCPPVSPEEEPAAADQAARRRYLAILRERYGTMVAFSLSLLAEDERVGSVPKLQLLGEEGVYVPLYFDAPLARRAAHREGAGALEDKGEARLEELAERELAPLALPEVLALPGHLAIVGDAGSGKTTLLHVLTTALVSEHPDRLLSPEFREVLPSPRPLPVLLPLRLFEHACAQGRYQRCLADLLRFVDIWFAEWCPGADLPPTFLADHIRAGRAWFLLDALDEVADPAHRRSVRNNVIHGLASDFPGTRLIVTARVAGYRGARLDDRFTVVHVRDLDDEQRAQMVRSIYAGLNLSEAGRRAQALIDRFQGSPLLQELGRTPVMVWTAAVIHALRGELPESRAALYDRYVDILLKHSYKRSRYDTEPVEELSDRLGWRLQDRRHYLTYAAFQAHRLLEDQPERRGERRAVVGEDELADKILAPYFCDKLVLDIDESRQRSREFLGLMVARSGLLYETPQGYTIGDHLTMQEFLAACYLGDHYQWEDPAGYRAFLREKLGHSWWREVFILAAGYLAGKPGFYAPDFMKQLAAQGEGPEGRLAALALAARCLLQLRHLKQPPDWYAGVARRLAGPLYQQLYAEPAEAPAETLAPAALRQEAGEALGWLYGYPEEEGLLDPRFAHPGGLPAFVSVKGGWFEMGDDESPEKDEHPRHRVYLDPFELARYPTTNAMFAHFIADGGYADGRWWAEAIAEGRWAEGKVKDFVGKRDRPYYWDDDRYNNPAQPVVGVSWYEAVAFCRWLTATLDDGCRYHLPSEAQWERAARGPQGWRYPWGEAWEEDHCNSEEAGLGVPSPVGIFPAGAAHGGLEDMAGNVWEWCWDWYEEDYYAESEGARNPNGPEVGHYRVLRGGGWASEGPKVCRCGSRYSFRPFDWFTGRGFRCARTFSS